MCWEVPSLHIRYMNHIIIEMPQFTASLDCHPILTIEVIIFEKLLKLIVRKSVLIFLLNYLVWNVTHIGGNWKY